MKNVALKEKLSNRIESWKEDVNHLKLQLRHNLDETRTSFEQQKSMILAWSEVVKEKVDTFSNLSQEKIDLLHGRLDDLKLQAALARMDSIDSIHDQQKKLSQSIHDFRYTISKLEKEVGEDWKEWVNDIVHKLYAFQIKIELSKAQLLASKNEVAATWKDKKDAIEIKLQQLNFLLQDRKNHRQEKLQHFTQEMAEAWKHLRSAVVD